MWDEYHTGIRSPKEIKTFADLKVTLMQGDTVCWSGKCSLPEAEKDGMIYSEDGTSIGMFEYLEYHRASSETPAYIAAFLPGGAEERHSVRFVRSIGA